MHRRVTRMGSAAAILLALAASSCIAAPTPTREEAARALRRAAEFFHGSVASHNAYVWRCTADLSQREGEGKATPTLAWVQPPGTPTVGAAYLDAYDATGDAFYLQAARDTGYALARGQLRSGGWNYSMEFDPQLRLASAYRDGPIAKKQQNRSVLDDNTTQASARFLARLDRALQFKDARVHDAAPYALGALVGAQYPIGGWSAWWETLPGEAPHWPPLDGQTRSYPVVSARYPTSWSRTWTKDFVGCYVLNDNLQADMVELMLFAAEVYGEKRYLAAAQTAGKMLLLAQMPDPQPAWAQQYNPAMEPVWSRKFEPPAITSHESQRVIEALMLLYQRTGDRAYLEPIPRALAYLRGSRLPDGRLARFYELKTNKPLYFTRDYQLTYSSADMPTHYGFIIESRLDSIAAAYAQLVAAGPSGGGTGSGVTKIAVTPELQAEVRRVVDALDNRGAWVEPGRLDGAEGQGPETGLIQSQTFATNIRTLSQFLAAIP